MIGASLPHGRYSPQDTEVHLPNFFFRVLIILLLGTLTLPLEDSGGLVYVHKKSLLQMAEAQVPTAPKDSVQVEEVLIRGSCLSSLFHFHFKP